jgi:prepilin-type processing-associated H-X9-DG protein
VLLTSSDRTVSLANVTDGSSQTIMVGEAPDGLHSIWIGHKDFLAQSTPINAQVAENSPWQSCGTSFKGPYGNACDWGQEFHSYHAGGAQFLLVDGSAHFLEESLDIKVLAALLSRCGGETISNVDF